MQHDAKRPEEGLKLDADEEGVGAEDPGTALRGWGDGSAGGGAEEIEEG